MTNNELAIEVHQEPLIQAMRVSMVVLDVPADVNYVGVTTLSAAEHGLKQGENISYVAHRNVAEGGVYVEVYQAGRLITKVDLNEVASPT